MTETLTHSWFMLGRHVRDLLRQPIWIFTMLTTPFVWLLLYSQLFRRVVELPGFETGSYLQFLVPGVVVMTSFFNGTWNGMSMINDLDRGIIERFLATPARRTSLVLGHVMQASVNGVIQGVIILALGYVLGARVHGGLLGWLVILAVAGLVAACFAGMSNGIALLTRREESMIALSNFIALPLLFLSSVLMAEELMPRWIQWIARLNPVHWGAVSAREAVQPEPDWGVAALYVALLLAFAGAMAAFATWCFRVYRRTL
ncbi:MAG: ABC transporter permease [Actinomycetota bacterium]|nr:ABC transporter permease [Actinomycetota bacterium]